MSLNPWIRRRFLLRAFASAATCLFAGVLIIVASRSLSGWSLLGAIVALLVLLVFASREVASWWQYARFCPHCGEILCGAWCDKCQQHSTADLLMAPAGIFDTRLYNKHHDEYARLISLVMSIAFRDRCLALRLVGTAVETRIWSLDEDEGWVEWIPVPSSLLIPIASAVMTVANGCVDPNSHGPQDFKVVDSEGVQFSCKVRLTYTDDRPELLISLDGRSECLPACIEL